MKYMWPLVDFPDSKIMVNIESLPLPIHLTCPTVNTGRIYYLTFMFFYNISLLGGISQLLKFYLIFFKRAQILFPPENHTHSLNKIVVLLVSFLSKHHLLKQ